MSKSEKYLISEQRLGLVGTFALILLISFLTPMSCDMYIPALSSMTVYFDTTEIMVNQTMILFFLFFAISILIFGSVSDRYGRKPVLVGGFLVYMAGSIGCALSSSIVMLIAMRIVQAIGSGAANVVGMAMIKDCFREEMRERVLMINQVLFVLAPVIAPIIGGQILLFGTWRLTFWVLTGLSAICMVLAVFYQESLPDNERLTGSFKEMPLGMIRVARNKGFTLFVLSVGFLTAAFMGYISQSSYIYVSQFGLSQQGCSYWFAAMAGLSIIAPFICSRLERHLSKKNVMNVIFALCALSGVLVLIWGERTPLSFFLCFFPYFLASTMVRPVSTFVLLGQQEGDTGSASSLMNFINTALGCLGMVISTVFPFSYTANLGWTVVSVVAVAVVLWVVILRSNVQLKGVKR